MLDLALVGPDRDRVAEGGDARRVGEHGNDPGQLLAAVAPLGVEEPDLEVEDRLVEVQHLDHEEAAKLAIEGASPASLRRLMASDRQLGGPQGEATARRRPG